MTRVCEIKRCASGDLSLWNLAMYALAMRTYLPVALAICWRRYRSAWVYSSAKPTGRRRKGGAPRHLRPTPLVDQLGLRRRAYVSSIVTGEPLFHGSGVDDNNTARVELVF